LKRGTVQQQMSGRVLLVGRLASRDLRYRPVQAALLLVVIAAAMSALTLGLLLHGVTNGPYAQTRAATRGPDVTASSVGFPAGARGPFAKLAGAPGVTAHSGPYPVAWPVLQARGITADVMVEGRDQASAAVDQPEVTAGGWVRPGGVVLEREFADALGVGVGDRVTLGGRPLLVTGIAVTAAVPVYSQVCFYGGCSGPGGQPRSFDTGLVWVTRATAASLATPRDPLTYYLNLSLANPADARAFAARHQPPAGSGPPALTAWPDLRDAAATLVSQERQVLAPASGLLALLAVASVAVVAGGRMAEQERRVGLLKAVGGTPALTAATLLAEHLVVALAGAAAGLAAGWLASPLLTSPGASLLGGPGAPPLTWADGLLVAAAAIAVAAASTLVPAVRAARMSTVAALTEATRPPRRQTWLIALSSRLPVPLLLGLRLAARRPRRALLSAASFAVTATTIVAVLVYHATIGEQVIRGGPFAGAPDPGAARVSEVLLVVTVVMAILAGANAVFTTWATVLDARRFSAVTRSLGATQNQAVAGLSAAQLLPALAGALIGIPAGMALYGVVQNGGPQSSPSAWWLIVMVVGMLAAVAGLTAIPARVGARRPPAAILAAETA
jgi:ABC-type lipoprotein release transport system permease subunit